MNSCKYYSLFKDFITNKIDYSIFEYLFSHYYDNELNLSYSEFSILDKLLKDMDDSPDITKSVELALLRLNLERTLKK